MTRRTTTEIALSGIVALAIWLVAARLHLGEKAIEFARAHEHLQLDELFVLSFILVLWFFYVAHARAKQLSRETSLREQAERSAFSAERLDPMTGLPNRRSFRELVDTALARTAGHGANCAVLFVDLDGFKRVNDEHGHSLGDRLLCAVAARLRTSAPDGGSLARLGGDEFAILLVCDPGEEAPENYSKQILRLLQDPIELDGRCLSVNATIGVALSPQHGRTADELIHAADMAMYEGKKSGRGRVRVMEAAA